MKNRDYKLVVIYKNSDETINFSYRYTTNIFTFLLNILILLKFLSKKNSESIEEKYTIYLIKKFSKRFNQSIESINNKLVSLILTRYVKQYDKCFILWLYSPRFYYIQDLVIWRYLILDYNLHFDDYIKFHHFWSQVFSKHIVFLYHLNSVIPFTKDLKENYSRKIVEKITLLEHSYK